MSSRLRSKRSGLSICRPPPGRSSHAQGRARRPRRGTSVHSAAQSRKDDRKPCGTASIPNSRMSLETVPPWIARARCDGKIRPEPSAISRASRRTSSARADSGTRCSRLAFIRCAGIVHVAAAKSISSQLAYRTSPDRHAVSTRNSKASTAGRYASDVLTPGERRTDVAEGQSALMLANAAALGQCGGDGIAGGVVVSMALRHGPLHHRPDTLAHAAHGLGLGMPVRDEHRHHVRGGDLVDALAAQPRQGVVPEARPPLRLDSCRRPSSPHGGCRSRSPPLGRRLAHPVCA